MSSKDIYQGGVNAPKIEPVWGKIESKEDLNFEARFLAIVESISKLVKSKADINHNHDDRYYSQEHLDDELNTIITTLQNVVNDFNSLETFVLDKLQLKLNLSGGTMTGPITFSIDNKNAIQYQGTKSIHNMIRFIDNIENNTGNGISIGGGGLTIIGGGESALNVQNAFSYGGEEKLILCNDSVIDIWTNCQYGDSQAAKRTIDNNGNFSGNAANVTGTVAIEHGGTNATTVDGARANLGIVAKFGGGNNINQADWHDAPHGITYYHYEAANITTYHLPFQHVEVVVINSGSGRGVAIAFLWPWSSSTTTPRVWYTRRHSWTNSNTNTSYDWEDVWHEFSLKS